MLFFAHLLLVKPRDYRWRAKFQGASPFHPFLQLVHVRPKTDRKKSHIENRRQRWESEFIDEIEIRQFSQISLTRFSKIQNILSKKSQFLRPGSCVGRLKNNETFQANFPVRIEIISERRVIPNFKKRWLSIRWITGIDVKKVERIGQAINVRMLVFARAILTGHDPSSFMYTRLFCQKFQNLAVERVRK